LIGGQQLRKNSQHDIKGKNTLKLSGFFDVLYFFKISYLLYASLRREPVRRDKGKTSKGYCRLSVFRGDTVYFNLTVEKKDLLALAKSPQLNKGREKVQQFQNLFFF